MTSKPHIHTYRNQSGEGRVLNMQLCDESVSHIYITHTIHHTITMYLYPHIKGRIQAVAFNDVADKLDSVFEAEKVYAINGRWRADSLS